MTDDIVIIGVGETPFGKLEGHDATQLQAWAALEAIQDAGISLQDVDGLINQNPYSTSQSMFALTLSEYLGISPTYASAVDVGGSVTVMTMLQQAAWAIQAGHCRYCLVLQGENMATARPPNSQGHVFHTEQGGDEFKKPFGVQGALIPYAMVARRYRDESGATDDDCGAVAVQMRRNAMRLTNRQTREPISMDDYRASPVLADPLRRLDCSLVSDGGIAFVLTSRAEADRLGVARERRVVMRSFAMQATHCSIASQPDLSTLSLPRVAKRAFDAAGIGIADMDVLLVHDAFTFSVLLQLEALGVCARGEAGALFARGDADISGRFPVNPHGGLLSQAHFGGGVHGIEAVRQLRGDASGRQVANARRALWCGNGGIFSVFGVMVLERGEA